MRTAKILGSVIGFAAFFGYAAGPALAQDAGKPKHDKPAAKAEGEKHGKSDGHKDHKTDAAKPAAGAEVGSAAPDFTLTGTDGKTVKLSDLKDKVVVLEWINRDCPVCQKQMPKMVETATALQKKNVVWLAIDSTHSHATADNAEHVKKHSLPYVILDDAAGTVGKAYGAKSTPTMFVINKGTIAYSGSLIPEKDEARNYVTEAVEAVLAGKPVPTASTKAYGCSVKYKKD